MKRVKAGTSKAATTIRKEKFRAAYLKNGGNGYQAALAAGYKAGRGAAKAAERLSREVAFKEKISQVLAKAQENTQLTADEVMASLARDLRFDPGKLYRPDGTMHHVKDLDDDTRLALRAVEVDELFVGRGEDRVLSGVTKKVKFPEKTAAREQGMKKFGLYELDNEQTRPVIPQYIVVGVKPGKGGRE